MVQHKVYHCSSSVGRAHATLSPHGFESSSTLGFFLGFLSYCLSCTTKCNDLQSFYFNDYLILLLGIQFIPCRLRGVEKITVTVIILLR